MISVKESWESDYDSWYSRQPYDDREFFTDIANGLVSLNIECEVEIVDGLIEDIYFKSGDLRDFYIDGFDFDPSYTVDIDAAESDFIDILEDYLRNKNVQDGNYSIKCSYEQFYKCEAEITKYGDDTYDVDDYSVDSDGKPSLDVKEITNLNTNKLESTSKKRRKRVSLVKEDVWDGYDSWLAHDPRFDNEPDCEDVSENEIVEANVDGIITIVNGEIYDTSLDETDLKCAAFCFYDIDYEVSIDSAIEDFYDCLYEYINAKKLQDGKYRLVCDYRQGYFCDITYYVYTDDPYDIQIEVDSYDISINGDPVLKITELTKVK